MEILKNGPLPWLHSKATENFDDVWLVTISEGLDYIQNFSETKNSDLLAMTDGSSPFDPTKRLEERAEYTCDGLEPCK